MRVPTIDEDDIREFLQLMKMTEFLHTYIDSKTILIRMVYTTIYIEGECPSRHTHHPCVIYNPIIQYNINT